MNTKMLETPNGLVSFAYKNKQTLFITKDFCLYNQS